MTVRIFLLAIATAMISASASAAGVPDFGVKVVRVYPHDPGAFTEGLFYRDGYLYESTGLEGQSSIRKVRLTTGEVVLKREIPLQFFGEGIVDWKGRLFELTWRTQVGFIYDLATFKPLGRFTYPGEGWGLTHNAKQIIMSDGTPEIRFLNPSTLKEERRIRVNYNGQPVGNINELEWVKGEIYANIWQTSWIARIDPNTGNITGRINLSGLANQPGGFGNTDDVLNGIAYDAKHDRLFVTGKRWPKLYEIRLVK